MNSVEEARKYLLELYEKWAKEVEKIENGKFLGKDYSNPYYISVPDNWFDSDDRIMIVGEEGYGEWGAGKQYGWKEDEPSWKFNDFEKIINYNRIKILQQVDELKLTAEETNLCNKTNSAFWFWLKYIYDLYDNSKSSFIWNNFDKIHRLRNEKCELTRKQREKLHSTKTKILCEEIKLLKPTMILFFGWRSSFVLKEELGEEFNIVYNTLCPKGANDEEYKSKPCVIQSNGKTFIISWYHPGRATKKYRELFFNVVKERINCYENREN